MRLHTSLIFVALVAVLAFACMVAEAAPRSPKYRFWWDRPRAVEVPKGAILYWRDDCKAMIMDFAPERQPAPGWVPIAHCARI